MKRNNRMHLASLIVNIIVLALLADIGFAQPDPGAMGPMAVTRLEYNLGDTAFMPTGFPGPGVEIRGSVHFPTNLTGGPFPLIVFLHGRHATCSLGSFALLQWPCSPGTEPIPSFRGYDYISERLASWGHIVISISANGINARDNSVFDLGANARAQLIQRHLDQWRTYNTTGGPPFGTQFMGRVNLDNVGTMGHSRGGEGVVAHFLYNGSLGSPYTIKAVFPLAPVDFNRPVINNVPLAVLLPYCDGDVSDLQGVHFYDDARYNVPGDQAPKHTILVMGANHNYYNTIWTPGGWPAGAADDWLFIPARGSDSHCGTVPGNQRLMPAQQRGTGLAYLSAFFRTYNGGEDFNSYLTFDTPPPPSAMTTNLFVSYHPPDDPSARLDVNRLLTADNLTTNTLGGAVTQTGLTPYDVCGGEAPEPRFCLPSSEPNSRQPHTTPSARAPARRGLSQLRTGWDDTTAQYVNNVGGSQDVSGYFALQFRASVNYNDPRNPEGEPQDFSVTLTDANGNTATTPVSQWSDALFFPPGDPVTDPNPPGPRAVPKVVLNMIRIPLSAFVGVDFTNLRSVSVNFDQTSSGAALLTDLMFAN